jgi:hypothetical protein
MLTSGSGISRMSWLRNWFSRRQALKKEKEYRAWLDSKIFHPAGDVRTYFHGFRHVIQVNYHRLNPCPFNGSPGQEFLDMLLKYQGVYSIFRVSWQNNRWEFDEFGGGDVVFVATDSDEGAVMIALLYG